jgi:RNA polymerase sigma factor (sigma-70 family)
VAATNLTCWGDTSNLTMGNAPAVSEASLVSAAKEGQPAAFGELCERHAKRVFHTALRVTRCQEDAEDAVQDSFLNAFVHLESFDGRSSFATWLTRIAINAALMKLRKNRGSREIPMNESIDAGDVLTPFEPADTRPDPEERFAQQERQTVALGAVRRLRPVLRKVIEIREFQEASMKETAQKLGLSVAAAKGRLFHARAALRKSLRLKTKGRARIRAAA